MTDINYSCGKLRIDEDEYYCPHKLECEGCKNFEHWTPFRKNKKMIKKEV